MPYCIECGAKLIPDGAVSCVVCGTTAYNPEREAKRAEEKAMREKQREEMRRKEARDRESPQSGREDMMTAEEFFGGFPQSSPKRKIIGEDMMKAEEFFGGSSQSSSKKKIGGEDMMKAEEFFA